VFFIHKIFPKYIQKRGLILLQNKSKKLKFLDLFSGIGGFRLGMEMAGHECMGWCEINEHARKSYIAMHKPKEDEWFAEDIKKIRANEMPTADVWCFGFPCQDISITGKQQGLTGERSGLFYSVINLVKSQKEENKPTYLFIENVKNLLSINGGWDFAKVLFELDEAGYDAEWQVINSAGFVPQNRERIYIIGHLRGRSTRKVFPIYRTNKKTLKQLVSGQQGMRIYDRNGISCTLSAEGGGWGAKTGLYLFPDNRVRRLTPNECFRLQGFSDEYFKKIRSLHSDTQLYKQIGNAVTVPVIYEIAKKL